MRLGTGHPDVVIVNDPANNWNVTLFTLVIAAAWFTVRVNTWLASGAVVL